MEEAVAVEEKACSGRNLTRVNSRGEDRAGRGGRVRGEEADSILRFAGMLRREPSFFLPSFLLPFSIYLISFFFHCFKAKPNGYMFFPLQQIGMLRREPTGAAGDSD